MTLMMGHGVWPLEKSPRPLGSAMSWTPLNRHLLSQGIRWPDLTSGNSDIPFSSPSICKPTSKRADQANAIKASGKKTTPSQTVRAWKFPATSEVPMPQGLPEHMLVKPAIP